MSSEAIKLESKVVLSEDVLLKKVANNYVLINLKSQSYFGLDANTYPFYLALIEASSINSAINSLTSEFAVKRETLIEDLKELILEMLATEIINLKDNP